MKVVSYNIQYGKGKDGHFDLSRIAAEVEGADLIALQEVERFWARSGMVDQAARLGELLPDYYWVYGAGVDLSVSQHGAGIDNRRRQFGNMVMAKSPITMSRNHLLPKYSSTGPMSLQRNALECVVDTGLGPIRVYSVHLTHLSAFTRAPQIERLLEIHAKAQFEGASMTGSGLPAEWVQDKLPEAMPSSALLLGDFNCQPDSAEYERIVGPLSDYGGRITNLCGFVDAWVQTGHTETHGATGDVMGQPARLDYCFVSADLRGKVMTCEVDTSALGSDHQPLWILFDVQS